MATMLNTSKARNITKQFLVKWYDDMKKLSTYNKYSSQIDKLFGILKFPRNKIVDVGFDLKKNWLEDKNLSI